MPYVFDDDEPETEGMTEIADFAASVTRRMERLIVTPEAFASERHRNNAVTSAIQCVKDEFAAWTAAKGGR